MVAITQHRKRRFVLMAIEDFKRLKVGARDPRRAYRVEDTPPELLKLLAAGPDDILASRDEDDAG
jgi:hypothetical protein